MARRWLFGVVTAALIAVMMPVPAGAVTYDKLTYMTFSGPVQIPGTTLGAGTYRFRLTNPDTSRNVLQVLSNDGATVYAMFNTIQDHRAALTDEAAVTFRETPAGVPPAIKSLFYGGEYHGYEFVYPKGGPIMIAEVVPQPEITYTPAPAAEAVAEAIVEPVAEPVAEPVPEPVAEAAVEPLPEPEPVALPRTATLLPLMVVGGLTSLLGALGLGLLRRRVS
ncbi:MAG TPA: hypothetical protein VFO21_02795 [Vicinamibacterales bacterium]|nr:hypothetical protein [Vicinamibacterales bacterium]